MATRTEPTDATLEARASLELLVGDFEDKAAAPREFTQETSRGPWTVYSGPVSLKILSTVQDLLDGEDVPLENMVDVLILLARTKAGDPMFRRAHREQLLSSVDPMYVVKASEFLANTATESLAEAEEEAGKE